MKKNIFDALSPREVDRIIEMAWEDRTPFDAIQYQFGLKEAEVIELMRRNLKASSWRLWRARVQNRKTKHTQKRNFDMGRMRCAQQRTISGNKYKK
ncbi:MAG: TIGR03643 family protein [Bacteroidota bacterium]